MLGLGMISFIPACFTNSRPTCSSSWSKFCRMLCILPWSFFIDYLCILPPQSLCVGVLLQNQVANDERDFILTFHHRFWKKAGKPRKVSAGSLVLVQEIKDIIIEWGWLLAQLANGKSFPKLRQRHQNGMQWWIFPQITVIMYTCHDLWPQLMTKNVVLYFCGGGGNFNQKLQQKIYRAIPPPPCCW